MATSDNVIRAGLTPKLRDIPNLVSGLTYEAAHASKHLVQPTSFGRTHHTALYDPPIPEFAVLRVVLPPGERETHPAIDGPSIAIVTEGAGVLSWGAGAGAGQGEEISFAEGDVLFVAADTEISITTPVGHAALYRAFVEAQ